MNDYSIYLASLIVIYALLGQSYNFVFGLGRLLNLAHIASYAIGAYTTAILAVDFDVGALYCIPLSGLMAAFLALLLGAISTRLSGDYFAIGTLAFGAVVQAVLINWRSLTRGVLGIPGIPRPTIGGIDFSSDASFLTLISGILLISLVFLFLLHHGRYGRALRALAETPTELQSLGCDIAGLKNDAFIVASALAGVAGACFAYLLSYIDPSSFGLHEMVFVLSIVVLGKPGSFWGVLLSTCFLVLLPEPLRFLPIPSEYLGPLRQLLYASVLLSVLFWRRSSLFPSMRSV